MTNKTKHTPGPWQKDAYGFELRGERFHRVMAGLVEVATCNKALSAAEANARLIAAAPDLLAAVEGLLADIGEVNVGAGEKFHLSAKRFDAMRAALAKATGGK